MKILFVTTNDWKQVTGGGEKYLEEVTKRLADRGHDVEVHSTWSGNRDKIEQDVVTINRHGTGLIPHLDLQITGLRATKGNYDVIVVNNTDIPSIFPRKDRLDIVHTYHGKGNLRMVSFPRSWWRVLMEKLNYAFMKNKISVSEQIGEKFNIPVIQNGVDVERYTSKEKSKTPSVVYLGKLIERKGILHLPRIFRKVEEKLDTKVDFYIAGKGSMSEEVKEMVQGHENWHYHGYVSEEKKKELLATSWVNILPSYTEAFPTMYVLESIVSGTPIVVNEKYVNDRIGGTIPRNIDEFADGILHAIDNNEELSQVARQESMKFSWEKNLDKLEAVLRKYE